MSGLNRFGGGGFKANAPNLSISPVAPRRKRTKRPRRPRGMASVRRNAPLEAERNPSQSAFEQESNALALEEAAIKNERERLEIEHEKQTMDVEQAEAIEHQGMSTVRRQAADIGLQDARVGLARSNAGLEMDQNKLRSGAIDLEQKEGQHAAKTRLRAFAQFADQLKTLTPDKDGRIALSKQMAGMLPNIIPNYSGMSKKGKLFAQIDPENDILPFYEEDGEGNVVPLMNNGVHMAPKFSVLEEAAKIGRLEQDLNVNKVDKSKSKDPSQVRLVEWVAKNLTNGDMDLAWKKAQESKFNPQEMAAKLFLAEKKSLASQHKYSQEDMPSDAEIMGGIQNAMQTLGISKNKASPAPSSSGLAQRPSSTGSHTAHLNKALKAIDKGADSAAVRERLIELGVPESEINKAGL